MDNSQAVRASYIELLRNALTMALWDAADGNQLEAVGASSPELREDGRDWPRLAHTMTGVKRMKNLQFCVEDVLAKNVPGDFIETGVWRGGSCIFMRGILQAYGVTDRRVWVADSFEGLPPPDVANYPVDAGDTLHMYKQLAIPVEEVRANFRRYGLLDDQVVMLKGFFKDTLPDAPIDELALVRLDGDMYESTMDGLTNLYPKLSVGGYLIVDDFGLPGCNRAVLDFRAANEITEPMEVVDWTGVFWKKGSKIEDDDGDASSNGQLTEKYRKLYFDHERVLGELRMQEFTIARLNDQNRVVARELEAIRQSRTLRYTAKPRAAYHSLGRIKARINRRRAVTRIAPKVQPTGEGADPGGLAALVDKHYGDDPNRKGAGYVVEYERLFSQRRFENLRILELGVFAGVSMRIWSEYFPSAVIVGVDIGPRPDDFPNDKRVHFVQGSQDDPATLDRAYKLAGGKFDLIIDDASHIGYLSKRAFMYLFPKYLKAGGVYAVEDIGTSFLPEFPDGVSFMDSLEAADHPSSKIFSSHQNGMVGFIKQLIDQTMKTMITGAPALGIDSIALRTNIAIVSKVRA